MVLANLIVRVPGLAIELHVIFKLGESFEVTCRPTSTWVSLELGGEGPRLVGGDSEGELQQWISVNVGSSAIAKELGRVRRRRRRRRRTRGSSGKRISSCQFVGGGGG
jgi:hypothetical protein